MSDGQDKPEGGVSRRNRGNRTQAALLMLGSAEFISRPCVLLRSIVVQRTIGPELVGIAAPMLLLTAALLIWPCPAAPALEEPEIRPITKAAGARLEIDAVLELPPPPATQRSCSGYPSKCRSQRMRFGTQNIRGLRNKKQARRPRCKSSGST